jgi:hypothetical protein
VQEAAAAEAREVSGDGEDPWAGRSSPPSSAKYHLVIRNYGRDMQHLLDLLLMLPRSQKWHDKLAAVVEPGREDWFLTNVAHARDCLSRYVKEDCGAYELEHNVCQYVLTFFDRDDPEMHKALEGMVNYGTQKDGATGRRWAEDVCATAWRLMVPSIAIPRRPKVHFSASGGDQALVAKALLRSAMS